ncbi:polysaccharide biosynthesis protein [Bhargavaea cecembensis]|uniref:Polysaccharide biosynthesis protein n=1 Tax=Bhargavaea cecembensis TaxID=394098 RepID=A0A165H636_9BACL|nr:flippase [Bhargavaea cecembensis]KZE38885.1 polysaccharide biosynthesis protein [Bhargavaea cecembensis]
MLKKFKSNSLLNNTGIYTITSVVNKAIPFLFLPILTRYLSPEEYGLISMFALLVTFTSPFIGLSVNGAITRKYYNQENTNIWAYVFNSILILTSSTLLVGGLFYLFSDFIVKITSFPGRYLWLVIVFSLCQFLININLTLWQVQKKAFSYGLFMNLQTLLIVILSIVFVVLLGYGWKGSIYGQAIGVVLFAGIAVYIMLKNGWIDFKFNRSYLSHALAFGIPLIPHALSGAIISMTDRIFITNMVGLSATGIYTVGYQVGSIINVLALSFNNAYIPWLYEKLKKDDYHEKIKIVKFTYLYFVAIIVFSVIIGLFSPYLLNWFLGKSFIDSSQYVLWIALGYAFNGMYLMVVNYIFYSQRTKYLAIITFITSLINIALNYSLIKTYGAIGAAQATTIVFILKFLMVWIISAKVHNMPWRKVFNKSRP